MRCRFCREEMAYVHGHAACVRGGCPMFGVNQAECCDGETAENCPAPTSDVAAVVPQTSGPHPGDRPSIGAAPLQYSRPERK